MFVHRGFIPIYNDFIIMFNTECDRPKMQTIANKVRSIEVVAYVNESMATESHLNRSPALRAAVVPVVSNHPQHALGVVAAVAAFAGQLC
jgi:hypothetical protein